MENKIKDNEFQWVLRVYEKYYNGEENQKYEEDIFSTEKEALDRLKEMYESALKEYRIYDSSFDGHKATYSTKYYNRIESDVCMYIVKEKINYIDMTIEEFFNKTSFIYDMKEVDCCSAEAYETNGFLMDLTDERWIFDSPYRTFKLQVYHYGPDSYDCCYRIIGKGFSDDDKGREYYRDDKMSKVLQDIKNDDNEYYNIFLSNIKKIIDSGGEYIIDIHRQEYEYNYLLHRMNEFCLKFIGENTVSVTAKGVEG